MSSRNNKISPPKLGVYTSTDGSAYSKPKEVRDMLKWIIAQSNKKQTSFSKIDFIINLQKVIELYTKLLRYSIDPQLSPIKTENLYTEVGIWITTPNELLLGRSPLDVCVSGDAEPLISFLSSKTENLE